MDLFSPPPQPQPKALSVTQLLRRMKQLIESQIGELWIEGEVSNLKKQGSGHWYFSLKDEGAQIQCAMFSARNKAGSSVLADGAKVRVFAEASVYEPRGQLQVIVMKAELAGSGELQARFEALKRKLAAEGLFETSRKKKIPFMPMVIGIITSASGAALQDILNVLSRRAPWVQPVLFPVRVQGRGAEMEIAEAIGKLSRYEAFGYPRCDVLIVGRGGGSLEDLWNFNEEVVARAIAACVLPVISAVGHEIDFTIADFVADLRAPTPSAAAELAVADGAELLGRLEHLRRRMRRSVGERLTKAQLEVAALRRGALRFDGERLLREPSQNLDLARTRLKRALNEAFRDAVMQWKDLRMRHAACHPAKVLERRLEAVSQLRGRLERCAMIPVERRSERVKHLRGLLRALGPQSAFQRGFSIAMREDGSVVTSASALQTGDKIRTRFADGETKSVVE